MGRRSPRCVAAVAQRRGRPADRHRGDPRCIGRVHQRARHLRGVPRADLGGIQVRHARRDPVDRDRDRCGDRHHRQRRRAVLQAAHRPQDPEHTGLHRRDRDDDAVPRRHGQRARAGNQAAGPGQAPRGRAGGAGAPSDRARPARLRLPGAVLHAAAHPYGREGAGPGERGPRRPARAGPGDDRGADPRRADRDPRPHLRAGS